MADLTNTGAQHADDQITRAEADRLVSELKWHKRDESFAISMDQDGDHLGWWSEAASTGAT